MRKPNEAIGTCPCPICSDECAVKQFRHRATTDGQRRNAGKLYMDCKAHGRFGFDGAAAMQEWIRKHAKLYGQTITVVSDPAPAASSAEGSAPAPAKPADLTGPRKARRDAGSAPSSVPPPKPQRKPWGFFA